ncbi:MAG: DUF2238 domain-containing protein [Phycisphaeraceae bacterium]|nr:DUF2238 domain-containing protein [Phycisphaerales bacterium]QOJ17453.1 MAG: DUF2238 domain-containing protein [Phycisphaeraceae bacterium]
MASPSSWPLRLWLLIIVILAMLVSAIGAADFADYRLEMLPLPPLVLFLWWLEWKHRPLSNLSYILIFLFLLLHVLGAHYLYSYVPYDDWSRSLFGTSISEALGVPINKETGLPRNHYDRLVHFLFGVMMLLPMLETVERLLPLGRGQALIVAVAFLAVLSKLYEVAEWMIALIMDPEDAEQYNGQQGDMFDAHKDMTLALTGSIIAAVVIGMHRRLVGGAALRVVRARGDARRKSTTS